MDYHISVWEWIFCIGEKVIDLNWIINQYRTNPPQDILHEGMRINRLFGLNNLISEKSKKKMSLARLGKAPWNKGKTGVYSEETRVAMGASNKGKIPTEETKRKRQETRKNNLTNRSKK